ncbi:MAG: LPS translocon maturation chaperone LptM [Gammaproteobacteria bacterium]
MKKFLFCILLLSLAGAGGCGMKAPLQLPPAARAP